jgi:hypothetical protein
MGQLVPVMARIEALYQQYADGRISDTECLDSIKAVCNQEIARVLSELRLKEQGYLNRIADLTRDVQEGSDLLELVMGSRVNDTIPAPPNAYLPPVLFETIPSVVVGDEVQYEVVPPGELFPSRVKAEEVTALSRWESEGGCSLEPGIVNAMAGGNSLSRFGSNEPPP